MTFEYTLLAGVNDAPEQAERLHGPSQEARVARQPIPYSRWTGGTVPAPDARCVFEFRDVLENMNVPASIRQTRGLEAAAACGQLRNAYQKNPLTA